MPADAELVPRGPRAARHARQFAGPDRRTSTGVRVLSATAGCCELWHQLELEEFSSGRRQGREAVSWDKVPQLLVVNRLIDPGSEFQCIGSGSGHGDGRVASRFRGGAEDRLYRCLNRLLAHKQDLFVWLKQSGRMFQADFEVLLYDLTSTYF